MLGARDGSPVTVTAHVAAPGDAACPAADVRDVKVDSSTCDCSTTHLLATRREASRIQAACTCSLLSDEPQGRGCGGVCRHAIDGRAAVACVLGVVGGIDVRAQLCPVFLV